jgi:hypothetical protein
MTTQEIFTELFNECIKGANSRNSRNQVYAMGQNKFFLISGDEINEMTKEEAKAAWKARDKETPKTVYVETGDEGASGMEVFAI